MHDPLNKLKQAADAIRLSHDEKAIMRANLFAAIDAAKYTPVLQVRTAYVWASWRYSASFALLLVFVLGGGTAYAAQGALPGGLLYPVKVYVNESVAEALATSPEAKLSFHASRAEERTAARDSPCRDARRRTRHASRTPIPSTATGRSSIAATWAASWG